MKKKDNHTIVSDNLPKHIKKGHQLVFSRQDLSAREADMFALMIANMLPEDWKQDTPHYSFTAEQLSKWLNIDSKHVGSNLNPVSNRLASRKIGIKVESEDQDTEFDYRPLFKHIAYKKGILTMVPNDMLKKEYIAYNQGFALINTKNFFNIKKEYSKRLYEILSRFKDVALSMHPIGIEELKGLFGLLSENGKIKKDKISFKSNNVFMKRCIRDSIVELSTNEATKNEIIFHTSPKGEKGFDLIKQGNKIISIKFLYQWKHSQVNQVEDAQIIIHQLESKRITGKIKLSIQELQKLKDAYTIIGDQKSIEIIDKALESKVNNNIDIKKSKTITDQILELKEGSEKLEY